MSKPEKMNIVWASQGVSVDPGDDKFQLGWEAEIPPYQYFNYILNKHSSMLNHVNTYGIPEWDSDTDYVKGSKVMYNEITWTCVVSNSTNEEPGVSNSWYDKEADITKIPVGTIMMFDANSPASIDGVTVTQGASGEWVDNSTIPGWYACVDGNQEYGCPNLVDKFIMGKVKAGNGTTGGANTYSLTTAQLPNHSHSMTHNHTISSGASGTGVANTTTDNTHYHRTGLGWETEAEDAMIYGVRSDVNVPYLNGINFNSSGTAVYGNTNSITHTHNIYLKAYSGNTGTVGSGSTIDNKPAYYSVIFIRKAF